MSKIVETGLTDGQFVGGGMYRCLWEVEKDTLITSCFMKEPMQQEYKNYNFCPWCGDQIFHKNQMLPDG